MVQGTGVVKLWYDNGVVSSEISMVRGLPTGRQRAWDETGAKVAEVYWIKGKRVSRKKYSEARKTDAGLPEYP